MEDPMNDNTNNSNRLKLSSSRFGYWFKKALPLATLLMPIAYIGVGCFVLLSERTIELMQPTNRYMLSGLLIIYGVFRSYRILKSRKVKDENQ